MKKNCIRLIFALLILFSGCKGKSDSYDIFGRQDSRDLERVPLTIYLMGNGHEMLPDVIEEIEKKSRKDLNIDLDIQTFMYNQYENALRSALGQGESIDLFAVSNFGRSFQDLYDQEVITELDDLLPEYAPAYYSSLDEGDILPLTFKGKLLAIPSHIPRVILPSFLVRKDLMAKYNMTSIKDLDDFEDYLDQVMQNEDRHIVLGVNLNIIQIFAAGYGYVILDQGLELVYKWDDPEMKVMAWEQIPVYEEIINRVYNWYKKGYFEQGVFYNIDIHSGSEKWGGWIANQLSAFQLNTALAEKGSDLRYDEYPVFPEARIQKTMGFFQGLVLNSRSLNPERAMMFIEWIYANQKNFDLIRYGIKGKTYKLDGDKYYLPEGTSSNQSFLNWQYSAFTNIDYERVNTANSTAYRDNTIRVINEVAEYTPHKNFRADLSEHNTRVRYIKQNEMYDKIARGYFDSDIVEQFIAQQKESGIDGIVASVQKQLDEWRKNRNEENQ